MVAEPRIIIAAVITATRFVLRGGVVGRARPNGRPVMVHFTNGSLIRIGHLNSLQCYGDLALEQ